MASPTRSIRRILPLVCAFVPGLLGTGLLAPGQGAQIQSRLDLGTGYQALDGAAGARGFQRLATSWTLDANRWGLLVDGALESGPSADWIGHGAVQGDWSGLSLGDLRGGVRVTALSRRPHERARTGRVEALARMGSGDPRLDWWVEGGGGRAWNSAQWLGYARGALGAGCRLGRLQVTAKAGLVRFTDSAQQADAGRWIFADEDSLWVYRPGPTLRRTHVYSDAELGVRWTSETFELDARGGVRLSDMEGEQTGWGQLRAAWWLGRHTALVASSGRYPSVPQESLPAETRTSIGLRIDLWGRQPRPSGALAGESTDRDPPRFSVHRIRGNVRRVQLRVDGARRVELAGDFNNWQSAALAQTAPGIWQGRFHLAPGTHRVSVKIDGAAWIAPPGLPAHEDEFGRSAGVFVVP